MPIKPRSHRLIFFMSWIAAFAICVMLAQEKGFSIERIVILAALLVSLLPAAIGYLLISKLASFYDDWRYRNGHDDYRQGQYEDDAGFIHLNQTSARINKHETDLKDMIGDAGSILSSASENANQEY